MLLGVNIDHVATLRQARKGNEPEPLMAAIVCLAAGADSIVVHLREDRRHINDKDVHILRKALKSKLNLEMSIAREIVDIACKIKPDQATLVPEKRQELTTEGGLDVINNFKKIKIAADKLKIAGIAVSLFIDPKKNQIDATVDLGIDLIELHTGHFASAKSNAEKLKYFNEIKTAVGYARDKGIHVFAGHGLDYENVKKISMIKGIEELNIGYSIICRAIFTGLPQAVSQMKRLIA